MLVANKAVRSAYSLAALTCTYYIGKNVSVLAVGRYQSKKLESNGCLRNWKYSWICLYNFLPGILDTRLDIISVKFTLIISPFSANQ